MLQNIYLSSLTHNLRPARKRSKLRESLRYGVISNTRYMGCCSCGPYEVAQLGFLDVSRQ